MTEEEIQRLYADYRKDGYFKARSSYEFWYTRRANDGIGSDEAEIDSRKQNLSKVLGERSRSIVSVLDYGGDRGQFIPDGVGTDRYVYELSNAVPVKGVTRLASVDERQFDFVMLAHVLEHCSEPKQILEGLKRLGHEGTLFYFEVPFERPSLRWAGRGRWQEWYDGALLRAEPLLQLVDLYSTVGRLKMNFIPPLGLQKCSEHLNFFNERSLQKLVERVGFELIDCGVAPVATCSGVSRILYGLARLARDVRGPAGAAV